MRKQKVGAATAPTAPVVVKGPELRLRHGRQEKDMGEELKTQAPVRLRQGGVYVSRDEEVWVCFKTDSGKDEHARARCVRVSDDRVEYFYSDGRYDTAGEREHCLVQEVAPS